MLTVWRSITGAVLLVSVGLPLAFPFFHLLSRPALFLSAWAEYDRLAELARETLLLAAGVVALALPTGVVAAFILWRTSVPFPRVARLLVLASVLVPLPLFAASWQAALGSGGWLPWPGWQGSGPPAGGIGPSGIAWKPWALGLPAAVWVHAVAGLPWVILLVGEGLRRVEPELEEDALTVAGPWRVLWSVCLPRARLAVGIAALWLVVQTVTEITITDMMQVRTFAEEVYTQAVRPEPDGSLDPAALVGRSVALSLPLLLLTWSVLGLAMLRWQRTIPPPPDAVRAPPRFCLGRERFLLLPAGVLCLLILVGMPVGGLLWKAGLSGAPPAWSPATVLHELDLALRVKRTLLVESVTVAAGAAAVTAALALLVAWLSQGARGFRVGVVVLLAAAWAVPAPVVGLGLKETIQVLLDLTDSPWLARALYHGPSSLPVAWAYLVRLLPFGVALLWPALRSLPRELTETARIDGAGSWQELRHVVLPWVGRAWLRAWLALTILALGELGANKLVATPGAESFAHELFSQMHYGVTPDLAAQCLLMLAVVLGGAVAVAFLGPRSARLTGPRRH